MCAASQAAGAGQAPTLAHLLSHPPSSAQTSPSKIMASLLLDASKHGQCTTGQLLLQRLPREATSAIGLAACAAARCGHAGVLQLLLQRGPSQLHVSQALIAASQSGHVNSIRLLLGLQPHTATSTAPPTPPTHHSSRPNTASHPASTPHPDSLWDALVQACNSGHPSAVEELLRFAPGWLAPNSAQLLLSSLQRGHADVMRTLLRLGANRAALTDAAWADALAQAASLGHLSVVQFLIEELGLGGAEAGPAALRAAARNGREAVVQYLLQACSRSTASPTPGATAASPPPPAPGGPGGAAGEGGAGAGAVGQNAAPQQPAAACAGSSSGSSGGGGSSSSSSSTADRRRQQQLANSALQQALEGGHAPTITLLINNGADVNAAGGICLLRAVLERKHDAAAMLLAHGADAACGGGEPLRAAARAGDAPMLRLLLKHGAGGTGSGSAGAGGASASATSPTAATGGPPSSPPAARAALLLAAQEGHAAAVKLLLEFCSPGARKQQAPLLARELMAQYDDFAAGVYVRACVCVRARVCVCGGVVRCVCVCVCVCVHVTCVCLCAPLACP